MFEKRSSLYTEGKSFDWSDVERRDWSNVERRDWWVSIRCFRKLAVAVCVDAGERDRGSHRRRCGRGRRVDHPRWRIYPPI